MSNYTNNRSVRRTRMASNRMNVVMRLVAIAKEDETLLTAIEEGMRNKAFGRLINKWIDPVTRQSVQDKYVDEEAREATSFAINIVAKQLREAKVERAKPTMADRINMLKKM